MTPDRAVALRAFGAVDAFNRHRAPPSVARMLARVTTFTIDGLDPRRVTVEIDVRAGLPNFAIVGLADRAVREARERVRAAILNSGFEFPLKRRHGEPRAGVDAQGRPGLRPRHRVRDPRRRRPHPARRARALRGLRRARRSSGEMRPCRGALAVAEGAARAGLTGLVVPRQRAIEAALVDGLEVRRRQQPRAGGRDPSRRRAPAAARWRVTTALALPARHLDLADVRGHTDVVEALTIAAAGAHNLLMSGPPGVGQDDARAPAAVDPAAADAGRGGRGDAHPQRGGPASRRRAHGRAAVPRAASPDLGRPAWSAAARSRVPARRASPITACSSSTSCPSSRGRRSRRCASRWRTAAWRSCAASGRAIFPTRFLLVAATNPCPCGHAPARGAAAAAKATSPATPGVSAGRCWTASISSSTSSAPRPSASRRSRPRPRRPSAPE